VAFIIAVTYSPAGVERAPSPANAGGGNVFNIFTGFYLGCSSVTDNGTLDCLCFRHWRARAPALHAYVQHASRQVSVPAAGSARAESRLRFVRYILLRLDQANACGGS
jgi:hypothetical protein